MKKFIGGFVFLCFAPLLFAEPSYDATKPLEMKFTAVDGAKVNLAKLRGKVVLIEFWKSSSPPCRELAPIILDVYKKYHDQGFEIIGISLDSNKESLTGFTLEHGMPWPEFYDGLGWQNEISSKLGVETIPSLWLIDKKGMVATTDASEDLAGQVNKLLKEP